MGGLLILCDEAWHAPGVSGAARLSCGSRGCDPEPATACSTRHNCGPVTHRGIGDAQSSFFAVSTATWAQHPLEFSQLAYT